MSNAGIGERITDVTPTRSRIWIDVLSPSKRAVGVTARFELRFRTEGDSPANVVVARPAADDARQGRVADLRLRRVARRTGDEGGHEEGAR